VLGSFVLEKDEKVKDMFIGKIEFRRVDNLPQTNPYLWPKNGYLVLTTRRLVFIETDKKFDPQNVYFEIQLENLKGLSRESRGTFSKEYGLNIIAPPMVPIKNLEYLKYTFWCILASKENVDSFQKLINESIKERQDEVEREKKQERTTMNIIIDFASLKDYMKTGGLILQNFKCPSCGASVPFPEGGKTATCPYCNATIKVEDIFEKIRSLI
jgi:ribosomal protein S27AE